MAWPASMMAAEHWQDSAFIKKAFIEVALKNEYSSHDGSIRKWRKPIRAWIDHQVPDQELHDRLIRLHLADLQRITGHSLSLVQDRKQANLVITLTRFESMQKQARTLLGKKAGQVLHGALCLANVSTDKKGEIVQARVIIPVDQARMHGKLVSCIVEELTQIMGLVNDSPRAYPSVFNDQTPDDLLSGLDYLLLKILYDGRVRAGMSGDEVNALLQMVIADLQKQGEVASAWASVSTGELYELLGFR